MPPMPVDTRPRAIFLMGPTAAGKTAMACALADRFAVDLISVDSAMVYRGLDIGTAKPDAETHARYPHQLIDIRDPNEVYSAADFRTDALAAMHATAQRGRIPLLVGGTGLYFRALQDGLSPLPEADAGVRARLQREADAGGWPALHERLAARDPDAAARIKPRDAQRIQRALEVIELGDGQSFTEQLRGADAVRLPFRVLKLACVPADRSVLHERIEQRFEHMLQAGLVAEVRGLLQRETATDDLPAWRTVGYRQARAYVAGQLGWNEFRQRALAATRQLAKRQITWLRGEVDARWIDTLCDDASPRVNAAVAGFLF